MESVKEKKGIFKRFTSMCVRVMERWLPDPFIFCALLTFLVFGGALIFTKASFFGVIGYWVDGFWSLLAFSMQMALVLVTGHALASSRLFKKMLETFASGIKGPKQAILIISLVSGIACVLNWGFGLVIGALFAKEIAKKVKGVDYRLLIASAYTGFLVWHGGLSGSIPLQLASGNPESLAQQTAGAVTATIPTSQTMFSPMNIFIVVGLLIIVPLLNVAMFPSKDEVVEVNQELLVETKEEVLDKSKMTPAERIENSLKRIKELNRENLDGTNDCQELLATKKEMEAKFIEAMDEDFNTAQALGHVFELVKSVNKALDEENFSKTAIEVLDEVYSYLVMIIEEVLGVKLKLEAEVNNISADLIELILELRKDAREQKNWALSDKIRDRLLELGIKIKDGKDKTTWTM